MANETTVESAPRGELLTWTEIKARYPDEWVVLVDSDWSKMITEDGVVVAHHRDRKMLRDLIRSLPECAIMWTGKRVAPRRYRLVDVDR